MVHGTGMERRKDDDRQFLDLSQCPRLFCFIFWHQYLSLLIFLSDIFIKTLVSPTHSMEMKFKILCLSNFSDSNLICVSYKMSDNLIRSFCVNFYLYTSIGMYSGKFFEKVIADIKGLKQKFRGEINDQAKRKSLNRIGLLILYHFMTSKTDPSVERK